MIEAVVLLVVFAVAIAVLVDAMGPSQRRGRGKQPARRPPAPRSVDRPPSSQGKADGPDADDFRRRLEALERLHGTEAR